MRRSALLGAWLLLAVRAAAEIEFEVVPAIVLDPIEPLAGAPLTVVLAEDLLSPGRELRLLDGDTDTVIETRRIGRQAIERFRFDLPADLRAMVIELSDETSVLMRWPAVGAEPVWPREEPTPGITSGAFDDGTDPPCEALPPAEAAGREALLSWLAACPLDNAPLAGRDLRDVDLSGRNLRRADIRGADLSDADLSGTILSGAVLLGARLDGADLSGADLEIADLTHASLFVSDLGGARLRGADLRGAVMTDTNFANADLTEARVDGAHINAADFTGAICPDGHRTRNSCAEHLALP